VRKKEREKETVRKKEKETVRKKKIVSDRQAVRERKRQ
jgi:hypothetical protein